MANRSSRPKPNRRKNANSTPGAATVTVTLLVLAVSVVSVATWDRYAFAEINLFPLWYVALALGLLCGVLFVAKVMEKGHSTGKQIGMLLLISLLMFFVAGTVLAHLNHFFDTSQPKQFVVVIEDKEYRHRKHSSHHKFTVTAQEDTFDIEVPRSHYAYYEVGDSYVIEYREGALGEPYYMAVGGVTENPETLDRENSLPKHAPKGDLHGQVPHPPHP